MTFELSHLWASMSVANKVIFLFIVLMAVLCIAVTVERMIALGKSARVSRAFAKAVEPKLSHWDPSGIVELTEQHRGSSLARLFGALTRKYLEVCRRGEGGVSAIDMVRSEATRQQEIIGAELKRGMNIIATIGSITPFVGLLGTVIGIIAAFQAMGVAGAGGIGTVSAGIAEALIETAAGLAVAIPAVIAFNYLTTRVAGIESALGRAAGQLIDEMEFNHAPAQDRDSDVVESRRAA